MSTSHSQKNEYSRKCHILHNSDISYRVIPLPFCLPSSHTGVVNPITGFLCNKVEPQASSICVPCPGPFGHGSGCTVNELEGNVSTCLSTCHSVTTSSREVPMRPMQTDPHCPTLATCDLVSTSRDVDGFPFTDPNIHQLLSQPQGLIHRDPSNLQLHTWTVSGTLSAAEAFWSMLPHVPLDLSESLLWQSTSLCGGYSLLGASQNRLIHSWRV